MAYRTRDEIAEIIRQKKPLPPADWSWMRWPKWRRAVWRMWNDVKVFFSPIGALLRHLRPKD